MTVSRVDDVKAETAVVVLAAGQSQRMGMHNKLLANFGGRPLLTATMQSIQRAGLRNVVVITGRDTGAVSRIAEENNGRAVYNPRFAEGMGTSLALGIQALGGDIKATFICLGDMPFITTATFERLLLEFRRHDDRAERIVVPACNDRRGHPVLFGNRYFPQLATLRGDSGARSVCRDHGDKVVIVEVSDTGIHRDIDTPSDLLNSPQEI